MMDKLVLRIIYGIPAVGKSTLAVEVAHRQRIRTVIHTDYIRELLRKYIPPDEAPSLAKVTHDAWEIYGPPTRDNVIAGFIDHVRQVAVGIRPVVAKIVSDGLNAVIEGAHFYSTIVDDLQSENPHIEIDPTLLAVSGAAELSNRIAKKEKDRVPGSPPRSWQRNIDAMLSIQEFLISDAHAHRIRVVTSDEWSTVCASLARQ